MRKLIGIISIFYLLPMIIWWLVLGVYNESGISFNNADWGSFGSFVGGVLSPLFSLVSIIFIYLSIKKNDTNHLNQLNILQEHNRREQLIKLVDIYNSKLDEPLDRQFSRTIDKFKSNNLTYSIYTDGSKQIPFPEGTVRDAVIDFYLSKNKSNRHAKEYIDLVNSLVANVELCFCKILELLLKIENVQEFEDAVDLVEALSEFHSTIGVLELGISNIIYSDDSPLLERLVLINERTSFRKELVTRYLKAKDLKISEK